MKTKKSITSIVFYVFAVLFLAYTANSIFTAYEYVAGYIEQGTISYATDFKDILALYVQQAGPYLVYALTLYGIGYIIDLTTKIKAEMNTKSCTATEVKTDVALTAKTPLVNAEKEAKKEIAKEAPKKEEVKKEEPKKESAKVEEPKKEVKKDTAAKEKKAPKAKTKKEEKPAVETKVEAK